MKSLIVSLLTIILAITGIYFGFDWLEKNNKIRKNPLPIKIVNSSVAPLSRATKQIISAQHNLLATLKGKKQKRINYPLTNQINSNKPSIKNKNRITPSSKKPLNLLKKKNNFSNMFSSLLILKTNKKPESCNIEDLRLDREAKRKTKKTSNKKNKTVIKTKIWNLNSLFPQIVINNLSKTVKTNQIKTIINTVNSNELFAKTHTKQYPNYAIIVKFGAFIYEKPQLKTKQRLLFGTKLPILETTKKSTNFTKCLLNDKTIWLKNNSLEIVPDELLTDDIFIIPGTFSLAETVNKTIKAFQNNNGDDLSKIIYKKVSVHLEDSNEILIFTKGDIKNLTRQTTLTYRKAGIPFSGNDFFKLKPEATNYKIFEKNNKEKIAIFPKDRPIQFKFRKINERWFFTGIIAHKNYYLNL